MKNLWNDDEASRAGGDALALRVYTSRLLGADPDLVLHGGGNTSVKASAENLFGESEDVLYVMGSGWDLATIEAPGFAPVKMDTLLKRIRDLYGDRVLVVPYVMPGFILSRTVYEMTRDADWNRFEGMILMNHGIFSFADDGKTTGAQVPVDGWNDRVI
jgi:rhamnose utilization protein RhaD (predicted bifunctional aldolase and dehydrogenase)